MNPPPPSQRPAGRRGRPPKLGGRPVLATIVGRNLTALKLPSRETRLSAPLGTTATAPSTEWDSQAAIRGRIDRVLIASMAETYARMDKTSADGMKTADAAVAAVVEGWARVRDDSSSVEWAVYVLDGKTYKLAAEGSGRPELVAALDEAAALDKTLGSALSEDLESTKLELRAVFLGSRR